MLSTLKTTKKTPKKPVLHSTQNICKLWTVSFYKCFFLKWILADPALNMSFMGIAASTSRIWLT